MDSDVQVFKQHYRELLKVAFDQYGYVYCVTQAEIDKPSPMIGICIQLLKNKDQTAQTEMLQNLDQAKRLWPQKEKLIEQAKYIEALLSTLLEDDPIYLNYAFNYALSHCELELQNDPNRAQLYEVLTRIRNSDPDEYFYSDQYIKQDLDTVTSLANKILYYFFTLFMSIPREELTRRKPH